MHRKHKNFFNEMQTEGMVDLLIHKVEDEAGKKVFTLEDKQPLMRTGNVSRVVDIFTRLFGEEIDEDAEKN